jgi:HK97 family phage prohead protease
MTMTATLADIAGRRAAARHNPDLIPAQAARDPKFTAQLRAQKIERDGKSFYQLDGVASVVDTWYSMWDMFGPYEEMVAAGAFDRTLAADPDVVFLLNHRGTAMARTKPSRTLELGLDEDGSLKSSAFLNPERQDVRDLILAVDDEVITEMSFAFRIVRGSWNPDYTTYTILEADLERGDVSAVNYGANPFTSISARAQQAFESIDSMTDAQLRAIAARLDARLERSGDPEPPAPDPAAAPSTGVSLAALDDFIESIEAGQA